MRAPTELEQKWLDALRSGKYRQCVGTLFIPGTGKGTGYCCLGVACVVIDLPFDRSGNGYEHIAEQLPVLASRAILSECWHKNDERVPFTEIADYIEQQIAQSNPLPEPVM